MSLTLHLDASDPGQLYTTYQSSGVHTGVPSDGSGVQVWDDEGDGVTDVIMQAASGSTPLWRSTTPLMLLPCLDFDGTASLMQSALQVGVTAKTMASFITAAANTVIIAFYAESITSTATAYNAHLLIGDHTSYWGVYLRNVSGQRKAVFYNYDGTEDIFEINISEATNYVLMFRHESNNLYASINGGTEVGPTASGNTGSLTGRLTFGATSLSQYYNGRIGEVKIWDTGNADGALTAEIAAMMTKWVTGVSTPKSGSDSLVPVLSESSSVVKYPAVTQRTESNVVTAGTSHTVTRPTAVAGNLVVIVFGYLGTVTTIGWPAGYTPIPSFKNQQTGRSWDAASHLDTGVEGTSITVTTTGTSTKSCHIGYSIGGTMDPAVQAPEIGTTATGAAGTSSDPPSVSGTGGSKAYLAIAAMLQAGEEADDDTWCTAAPAGYTNLLQKTTDIAGAATVNISMATAERSVSTATENPGVFTTAQTLAWNAQTLLIHPAVPTTPKAGSDTARPVVTEAASSLKAGLTALDTLRPVLGEVVSLVDRSSLTETVRPIIGEARTLITRSSVTETCRPILSEVASLVVRGAVSETVRPMLSEVATAVVKTTLSASDTVRPLLSAEQSTLISRTSTPDTLRPVIGEARSLVSRTSTADTVTPVVSEAKSLMTRSSGLDSPVPVLAELATLIDRSTRPDSLVPTLTESVTILARLSAVETVRPVITEQSTPPVSDIPTPKAATDTLRPVVTETSQMIPRTAVAETVRPILSEARTLRTMSIVTETLPPVLTEQRTLMGRSGLVETLTPGLNEAPALLRSMAAVAEGLTVHLSETAVVIVRVDRTDLLPPVLGELALVVPFVPLAREDALVLGLQEGPSHVRKTDIAPIIGSLRLVGVGLAGAGSLAQPTLTPATKGAVKVSYATVRDPHTR